MPAINPNATPLFPRTALHPAALARADAQADGGAPWCVAFSGGADSLALLITLREHWPERKIVALHFNHHLRGEASDGDEQFCRDVCAARGVELRVGHWERADTNASEAGAREQRHGFFDQQMTALGARVLWLGHQLDDIAETQLMRLARGSSTAGLAAPRPVHAHANGRVFLRPLLALSKREITGALRARGVAWREDATNREGDFFRNRIRRDMLPAFIAASQNNDALAGAALTRELLEEDAAALDAWLDELLPASAFTPRSLDLRALAGKPRALLRRALRRWHPASELARAGFEALLAICENPGGAAAKRTSVGDAVAVFENGILSIEPPAGTVPSFNFSATAPFVLSLPDGATLAAEPIALTGELRDEILSGRHDPSGAVFVSPGPGGLVVRSLQPGDRYQPLGAPGSAKISDLLINRKIPHARRLALPVVCFVRDKQTDVAEILWVPGIPPADAWKITAHTQQALHLTYRRGTRTLFPKSLHNSQK
ncbi:tRNA(Ile)-lysidine synthase [Ereboglobus sp. PH5-10]|uniref:tRNA lysidine(34) synthetase TilS n=1 Tax=Ereboglobus sp. PH5-10 TaxID=2940629 RepID=UPI0024052FA7|nr:tRNA lysidine(34) synthetase TilS [Ereboglobus sp. PH5-10]MDF9826577.1 tRNA(Ile)-lysidine synthase [Ereboglobus sp. PH5-10]